MVTSKKNLVAVVTAPRTSAMLGLTTWTEQSQSQADLRKAGLAGRVLGAGGLIKQQIGDSGNIRLQSG